MVASGDGTLMGAGEHSDTSPDAERVQMAILRSLPVWRRLALADQLYALTTALALADLRRRHPRASEADLRGLLAERRRAGAAPISERP